MKMIVAIIQPSRLDDVKEELYKVDVNLITVSEVLGHGRQKGVTEILSRREGDGEPSSEGTHRYRG